MNSQLLTIAIQEAPSIIDLLKNVFKKSNPNDVQPTDEEVITAYRLAFESSLAKDDLWLAAHPED
jgi:hypothetical protein